MNLDELLSQPLPPVADNGFSARVVARVKAAERRRAAAIMIASAAAVTILCLLVPLREITGDFAAALIQLGTSPLVGLAAALLVLTFLLDRLWADRRFLQF
jgi:hypothetical protein